MAYQSAEEYCLDTARNKGYNIISEIENNSSIQKLNNQFLICADTIVEINSEILEKPKNVDDCYRMLSLLNDKRHSVHTAVIIFTNIDSNSLIEKTSFVETTSVNFSKISYSDILSYVEIDKPFDKSGSYGIQGLGGCFVKSIEGCYYNVMGLPISRLSSELCTILSSFEKSKE